MAKDDGGSGIVWFVAGAFVGASVALLYAPKSGKDTRKYISKTTEKSKDALAGSGKELVDRGKDLYDKGRALAGEAADLFERGRKLVQG
jgi:gas vesicle protein